MATLPATAVRPLPRAQHGLRVARAVLRLAWLHYEIASTTRYLADCAADGLHHSLHLQEWRSRLTDMHDERTALLAQLRRGQPWLL